MKNLFKTAIALGSALLCFNFAEASVPNSDNTTTFLGPTLKLRYTAPFNYLTAYSIAAEGGIRNARVGGTAGFRIQDNQRLKISAEYLWQDLTYGFFSGDLNKWVSQFAIGGDYQYQFDEYLFQPQFDLVAYYSHAPTYSIGTVTGSFIDSLGNTQSFVNVMRIAGSNAGGLAPGISIYPWWGARVGVDANWDKVSYNKNNPRRENANGFGGTFHLNQLITDHVVIGGSISLRRIFNTYQGNLAWTGLPFYGSWAVGVGGEYTAGKHSVPNSYDAGVFVNYLMDMQTQNAIAQREATRRFMNLKGDLKGEASAVPLPVDDFLVWTADPAIYMPTVLAVPDESVHSVTTAVACTPPELDNPLPDVTTVGSTLVSVNAAGAFSGSAPLSFAVSTIPSSAPSSVTISSTSGTVSISPVPTTTPTTFTVRVTASNSCGSAINEFEVNVPAPL